MQRTVLIILTLLHHRKSHLSVKLSGFGDFCWKNFYFSFGKVWWFWSFLFLFTMVRRRWFSEISTFENFRKIFFFFASYGGEKYLDHFGSSAEGSKTRIFRDMGVWRFQMKKFFIVALGEENCVDDFGFSAPWSKTLIFRDVGHRVRPSKNLQSFRMSFP